MGFTIHLEISNKSDLTILLRIYKSGVICNQQNDGTKEFTKIDSLTNIKAIGKTQISLVFIHSAKISMNQY